MCAFSRSSSNSNGCCREVFFRLFCPHGYAVCNLGDDVELNQ